MKVLRSLEHGGEPRDEGLKSAMHSFKAWPRRSYSLPPAVRGSVYRAFSPQPRSCLPLAWSQGTISPRSVPLTNPLKTRPALNFCNKLVHKTPSTVMNVMHSTKFSMTYGSRRIDALGCVRRKW